MHASHNTSKHSSHSGRVTAIHNSTSSLSAIKATTRNLCVLTRASAVYNDATNDDSRHACGKHGHSHGTDLPRRPNTAVDQSAVHHKTTCAPRYRIAGRRGRTD